MKIKLKYISIFLLCLSFSKILSQATFDFPLSHAAVQLFRGTIFTYGLTENNKKTELKIYSQNFDPVKIDSLIFETGKEKADSYLQLWSDTLHGFLNIYLQKKEKKNLSIYRFDKNFKLIASIDGVDIARLNSISAFENEIFYDRKNVYTVKSTNDSSGRQFYLNKYTLQSELKNFEYDLKWQFPFERKNINTAHVTFANDLFVLVYVNVMDGPKRGQWLLKLNAQRGSLIKGSRINDKGDNCFYAFGKLAVDTGSGEIFLQGQKFLSSELDQKENKSGLAGKPSITFYVAALDSALEMTSRNEFKLPVTEAKGVVNKVPVNYIIRTSSLERDKEGNFMISADFYKSTNSLCYNFCNSSLLKLKQAEGKFVPEKNSAGANILIEKYFMNNDKLNMNGKMCIDSLREFEKLFYKDLTLPVKLAFRMDDAGNPLWLLKKSDLKKNAENFCSLGPLKNVYTLSPIAEISKSENPGTVILPKNKLLISRQTAPERFQLQLFNW